MHFCFKDQNFLMLGVPRKSKIQDRKSDACFLKKTSIFVVFYWRHGTHSFDIQQKYDVYIGIVIIVDRVID